MLKIFKFRKNREEDIKSWVFHTYKRRMPNPSHLILVSSIFIIMLLGLLFLDSLAIIGIEEMLFFAMSFFILLMWLLISLDSRQIKWQSIWNYWPILVFPLLALSAVVALIYIYPDPEGVLHRSDILGFCGNFLAFLGTFCLGYFIYAQDRMRETEKRSEKSKLLYGLIQTANSELLRLAQLAANEEYLKIPGNRERIELITYDSNWNEYYYEFEALAGTNLGLYQTVQRFFDTIVQVNESIKTGQIETAAKIYERYREQEEYSLAKYNLRDVLYNLGILCEGHFIWTGGSWIEWKSNIAMINKLCKKYYYVIENYIYTWLLKHHVNSTVADEDLRREVTDWLMENSPEIKEKLEGPQVKRLLSHVVYDCSLKFRDKSTRVNYKQNVYFLR